MGADAFEKPLVCGWGHCLARARRAGGALCVLAAVAGGFETAAAYGAINIVNGGDLTIASPTAYTTLSDPSGFSSGSYTGVTNVSATFSSNYIRQSALNISAGKTTLNESSGTLASGWPGGDNNNISILRSLSLTGGGQFDLTNNDLVIDYASGNSPFAGVEAAVRTGYASGAWNGPGLISADAHVLNYFTLLVLDTADANAHYTATPAGLTIDATSVIVKFTHEDDLNGDGVVNATDKAIFTSHWVQGQTAATHRFGDMDFDGQYTFNDVQLFNLYYNTSLPSLPEPGSLGLLVLGACLALVRKPR